ncbi:FtsX-like permease family protein [Actinoplanes hulinensis]|uniref:FtsX-like permease family protein n=1 Tax=Actinoplanes hulinensis TaxID=1144547 RepID=A0ABS7B932_9ACTN|nr:FtsX-like permease family protein [Actinoplanes hulinensis]MBW6437546.1 FtsX-like permease family protein [Actinoplanes hulinensis]
MGRLLLVSRLAVRDLRRRPAEAVLLLLAILAATSTLTLGLVLRDAASDPYRQTREATHGPDVVVFADLAAVTELVRDPAIVATSGPYPVVASRLNASGRTSDVQVIGRDAEAAAVDQPAVVEGAWVSDGGAVLEAAFADALGVRPGDPVTLGGRTFRVAGTAVTAAMAPYPAVTCLVDEGCLHGAVPQDRSLPEGLLRDPGLVWVTRADARGLTAETNSSRYVVSARLADPEQTRAFMDRYLDGAPVPVGMASWQEIRDEATELARDSQILLMIGAWLLGLLATASLAVLVGGRMADQTRRVGLLKAVGGTPGLVAAVLLAEYLLVALIAAVAGLTIGTLAAPLLAEPGAGLLGTAGTPSLTVTTAAVVTAVALGVAVLATTVPALRAARTSTVGALADTPRPPRRIGWLIRISTRMPVPLLLALRVTARRPRRALLAVAAIAVTVSGIYVALILDGFLTGDAMVAGYTEFQVAALRRVLLVWTVILLCLTAVDAVVITWATVLDNRRSSALARALGATPGDVSAALGTAQVLPALGGAVLGVFPCGYLLFAAIMRATGGDGDRATPPSLPQLAIVVAGTVLVVGALTAVPARLGGRRPVTEAMRD